MSVDFTVEAQVRADMGKGASRRLRHQGLVPGIVYGASKDPQSIALDHNKVIQHIEHEAFFSHILDLSVDGKSEKVVVKDMQRHPSKRAVLHMDFLRVSAKEAIRMNVPLHFTGEEIAPGIKTGGGIVSHLVTDVEISCLPSDLPEYIEIDMSSMNVGDSLHLSDIQLPKGVELVELSHGEEHDTAIANIHLPRAAVEEEEVVTAEEAGAESEPESEGGE
ncbi:MAG: 50S ribosomal protein L25/general stress protein Ctc [Gammaproteobacteria bacterium]|nr:50S ribosomal protein L25/general stress protein Ctc [Gammaproteobacteria bacterium]